MELEINPRMVHRSNQSTQPFGCGARTRLGMRCEQPTVPGRKRCRIHGGLSTGAPKGEKNGNYRNGEWTAEAIRERKWLRAMMKVLTEPEM
jgi:glucans biosynthesis protein